MGITQAANSGTNGTGKCAFFVAEQFAFDQIRRYRSAINRHKRLIGAFGKIMNCAGDQLLTGTRLAGNQDIRIVVRDLFD